MVNDFILFLVFRYKLLYKVRFFQPASIYEFEKAGI